MNERNDIMSHPLVFPNVGYMSFEMTWTAHHYRIPDRHHTQFDKYTNVLGGEEDGTKSPEAK